MATVEVKSFHSPDETRPFEGKGHLELVTVAGKEFGRAVFEPGWRWSNNVKPIAGTESCEFPHLMFVISGRMRISMDEGDQFEIGAGDVASIPPGHDAEVIGDEACVVVDVAEEDAGNAKPS